MIARLVIAALLPLGFANAQPSTVRIGVLGLFEPAQLQLAPVDGGVVRFTFAGTQSLEGSQTTTVKANGDSIVATVDGRILAGERLLVEHSTRFELSVPGKLSRRYFGALAITASGGELQPVVTMPLEMAVAAVLSGESDLAGPEQALLAQAVASRSYLSAGSRHEGFDFCDTTHCQYLTDGFDIRAERIANTTRGTVLHADGRALRAMFTRSCDGRTRTPQELGLPGGANYQSAACPICAREPHAWIRSHPLAAVAEMIRERTEQARLEIVRRLGWDAIPSNSYQATVNGDTVNFRGAGEGHGMGLCQRGAVGLALQGETWQQILQRYFPGATIQVAARN